jgi:hypothetical protein
VYAILRYPPRTQSSCTDADNDDWNGRNALLLVTIGRGNRGKTSAVEFSATR